MLESGLLKEIVIFLTALIGLVVAIMGVWKLHKEYKIRSEERNRKLEEEQRKRKRKELEEAEKIRYQLEVERRRVAALEFKIALYEAAYFKDLNRQELEKLKLEIHAPRVLLLSTANGGGLPNPSGPLYITAIDEAPDSDMPSVLERIQGVRTDKHYEKLIMQLIDNGFVEVKTSELPDCVLRDYYLSDGIEYAIVFAVAPLSDKFVYLSVAWTIDMSNEFEMFKSFIRARATNIEHNLNKNLVVGQPDKEEKDV